MTRYVTSGALGDGRKSRSLPKSDGVVRKLAGANRVDIQHKTHRATEDMTPLPTSFKETKRIAPEVLELKFSKSDPGQGTRRGCSKSREVGIGTYTWNKNPDEMFNTCQSLRRQARSGHTVRPNSSPSQPQARRKIIDGAGEPEIRGNDGRTLGATSEGYCRRDNQRKVS